MRASRLATAHHAPDALELRFDHRLARNVAPNTPAQLGSTLALVLGATRTAVGAATLAMPSLARFWVGQDGCTNGGKVLSRSLAARDVALGLGVLMAGTRPERLRRWVALAAVGDLADALGTMTGGVPSRPRVLVSAASLCAVAIGAVAVAELSQK